MKFYYIFTFFWSERNRTDNVSAHHSCKVLPDNPVIIRFSKKSHINNHRITVF
nr:MAG TPA: hypothetical protein [Caudoviricetes sp.]